MLSKIKLWLIIGLGGGLTIISILLKSVRADKTRLAKQVEVLEQNTKVQQVVHEIEQSVNAVESKFKEKVNQADITEQELTDDQKQIIEEIVKNADSDFIIKR